MKIGIFGGTFNPIHYGHLRSAEEVREILGLEQILFIPSGRPPLKSGDIAGAVHRLAMLKLATQRNRRFTALDIECRRRGKSYTVHTLEMLQKMFRHADLYFILGIDAFLDIPNWWKPEMLFTLAHFIIISRPDNRFQDLYSSPYISVKKSMLDELDSGKKKRLAERLKTDKTAHLMSVTNVAISSTAIRKRIKGGLSIKYLLPEGVESYIISKRLYKR